MHFTEWLVTRLISTDSMSLWCQDNNNNNCLRCGAERPLFVLTHSHSLGPSSTNLVNFRLWNVPARPLPSSWSLVRRNSYLGYWGQRPSPAQSVPAYNSCNLRWLSHSLFLCILFVFRGLHAALQALAMAREQQSRPVRTTDEPRCPNTARFELMTALTEE